MLVEDMKNEDETDESIQKDIQDHRPISPIANAKDRETHFR